MNMETGNTCLQLRNDPIVLSLPYNIGRDKGNMDRTFELYQKSIVINLHPSRNYLETFAQGAEVLYNEIDKTLCEGTDAVKINEESKFAKMRKNNLLYDETAERERIPYHCIPRCSLCCSDLFFVSENEFLYMIAWLLSNRKKKELAKAYLRGRRQMLFLSENYPDKAEDVKRTYAACDKKFYNIGETVTMLESCPFLNEQGRCTCYEARPGICRKYGTTVSCVVQYGDHMANPLYHDTHKQAIVVNPIFDEIIRQNVFLSDGKRHFMKQARPLFYFTEKYLSKENIKQTVKRAKAFAGETERDFLSESMDDMHEFIYDAGYLVPKV